jgi:hypothetical protein
MGADEADYDAHTEALILEKQCLAEEWATYENYHSVLLGCLSTFSDGFHAIPLPSPL